MTDSIANSHISINRIGRKKKTQPTEQFKLKANLSFANELGLILSALKA